LLEPDVFEKPKPRPKAGLFIACLFNLTHGFVDYLPGKDSRIAVTHQPDYPG
jgi:hypothetical protein